MKILLRIKYLGTNFCGWQFQPNGVRTVQKTVTDAAEALFGEKCAITGCSRTDSGVHALDFAATAELSERANKIPLDKIPTAFSRYLPNDVSVISATEVADDFHPRYDVVSKEYVYKIYASPVPDPFLNGRVWHFSGKLLPNTAELMNECAKRIAGKKDFTSFMAAGSKIEDAVRNVHYCDVSKDGDIITVRIAADGFLYNMVRIIAGTLLEAGKGKLSPDEMTAIIDAKDRAAAGLTAPPDGLYLNKVNYNL
nr:tRNA pseudouridine(38-40) synthase TruA [Clostridia bacterium]